MCRRVNEGACDSCLGPASDSGDVRAGPVGESMAGMRELNTFIQGDPGGSAAAGVLLESSSVAQVSPRLP